MEEDKDKFLKMGDMLKIALSLMSCSAKSCSEQKKKIMSDPIKSKLYVEYSLEKDANKKIQLLKKLNKNDIVYEYDACIFKHCNDILKSLMEIVKTHVNTMDKTTGNYKKLISLINIINKIIDNPNLITKKEHITYIRDMTKLMSSITPK
jgi:hypothetical protein